jgi:hypothetical protein
LTSDRLKFAVKEKMENIFMSKINLIYNTICFINFTFIDTFTLDSTIDFAKLIDKNLTDLRTLPVMTSENWLDDFQQAYYQAQKLVANISNSANVPQCCNYKSGTTVCSSFNPVYSSLMN